MEATAVIEAMASARVLVVGDAMLDRFVYGSVDRVSPEAPIPVLRMTREALMPGGACNVAANLSALGASAVLASVVGGDPEGGDLARLVREAIGAEPLMPVEAGRRTTLKTRYIAGSQQLLRADAETVTAIRPETRAALLDGIGEAARLCGAIVLSDYGKGVLCREMIAGVLGIAANTGLPVLVDPKGRDWERYRGAAALTPNRKELAEATGMPTGTDGEIVAAARAAIAASGVGAIVATRSEEGMTVVTAQGNVAHLRAAAREVYDVSGAGDTVVASLGAALAAGASLVEAAGIANLAAGIVVGKVGTAVVRSEELESALHHADLARGEAKVVPAGAAFERIARWRAQGCRVGFTNGVFDLLHPGHISLVDQAKAACDKLVVGLNSDASVKRLKGPERPVQSEAARATVLASLAAVDLVVVFSEDTPLSLIERIRPDVLVKGADYTVETVVGADIVQAHGGRVMLARLEDGHSTTGTIARLRV
ncbi:MAG: D-glycero-beta-D-manno-heptose-7-phosphate kinase [Azospirillaceae bacterium]